MTQRRKSGLFLGAVVAALQKATLRGVTALPYPDCLKRHSMAQRFPDGEMLTGFLPTIRVTYQGLSGRKLQDIRAVKGFCFN
jgi:hypothetical protein